MKAWRTFSRSILVTMMTLFSLFSAAVTAEENIPDKVAIPQSELVYMETARGLIVIQLTDLQSPNAYKQIKSLVKEGFYDGLEFYRVFEGFVAQGGEEELAKQENYISKKTNHNKTLDAEFTQSYQRPLPFQVVQSPALLAPETGYWFGFPAGRDSKTKEQWLLHCPGAFALARDLEPDTATTEFYIVIGQAPRHLDRNMSVIGRVVDGMSVAQSMPRGTRKTNGVIKDNAKKTAILTARMGDQLPVEQQIPFMIENTKSEEFLARLNKAKHNTGPFLVYPGTGNLDVCYHQPRISK